MLYQCMVAVVAVVLKVSSNKISVIDLSPYVGLRSVYDTLTFYNQLSMQKWSPAELQYVFSFIHIETHPPTNLSSVIQCKQGYEIQIDGQVNTITCNPPILILCKTYSLVYKYTNTNFVSVYSLSQYVLIWTCELINFTLLPLAVLWGGAKGSVCPPQIARRAEGWGNWLGCGADAGGRHAMFTLSTWPQLASKVRRSDILSNSR